MKHKSMSAPSRTILHTTKDIAERCYVSERTVRRWIRGGELTIYRLGRQIRISEEEFARFLRRHRE